jgi:hypothetical protein
MFVFPLKRDTARREISWSATIVVRSSIPTGSMLLREVVILLP